MDMYEQSRSHTQNPYEKFLLEHPKEGERVQAHVKEGRRFFEMGWYDDARSHFMRALAIFPLVPAALTNLAAMALQRGDLDSAQEYLSQVIEHFPFDPSAHAVAVRYWLERKARPFAMRHARQAVTALGRLMTQMADPGAAPIDPSLADRAKVIVLSTLSLLEADELIVEVYRLSQQSDRNNWDERAWQWLGIAHFNIGELAMAAEMFERANKAEAAEVYRYLIRLIEDGTLLPFPLDYNLTARMPTEEELLQANAEERVGSPEPGRPHLRVVPAADAEANRSGGPDAGAAAQGSAARGGADTDAAPGEPPEQTAETGGAPGSNPQESPRSAPREGVRILVARRLPSLVAASAIRQVFEGDNEAGEFALGLLFSEQWPHLGELLGPTIRSPKVHPRVKLSATLALLWLGGPNQCTGALRHLDGEVVEPAERFIFHVIGLQCALLDENQEVARAHHAAGSQLLAAGHPVADVWVAFFTHLSERAGFDTDQVQNGRPQAGTGVEMSPIDGDSGRAASTASRSNKIIPLFGHRSRDDRPEE